MRALKNKKRIKKNTEFIENYTRNTINDAKCVLEIDLFHESPVTLCSSKKKIRDLFQKFRGKFENSRYLLLTNFENNSSKHKMLISVDHSISSFEEIIQGAWRNSSVCVVDKDDVEMYAQRFSDFYSDAAETVPFTHQNSKQVKSKLFHRSRISN